MRTLNRTLAKVTIPAALAMPLVETTFARHRHPYWPRLQLRSRSWMVRMRLLPADMVYQYADGLRYTDLMADFYLGASEPVLSAIADFSVWFFVWDDRHDRCAVHGRGDAWARLRDQLHAALEQPRSYLRCPDTLVAAFADTVIRLCSHLGGSWNARFAAHFHRVVDAYDQEFRNRAADSVPTVSDYLELRRHTFAHHVWTDLLELAAGRELPDTVREAAAYRRAALACQDFAAWYNDLCSLPKELAGGELHNLGISLIHHHGLAPTEAAAEVHRRATARVRDYLDAEEDTLHMLHDTAAQPELQATVRSCLANMRNWFSAVYWFHHESGRYRLADWHDKSHPPYVHDPEGDHDF
jgi:epi-isozizaene synthase